MMITPLLFFFLGGIIAADPRGTITNVPGLPYAPKFKQYSGYIDCTDPHDRQSGIRHIHYYFTESQRDPTKDPLVLWLTGGPGCSSMLALTTENGPFKFVDSNEVHTRDNTKPKPVTLEKNPYSWNTVANVLWIDSPCGVGFSYGGNYTTGDDRTAEFNYLFMIGFLERFSEFKNHEFFVTGESYAGHYVPQLAWKIMQENEKSSMKINLKGYMVGNPSGINDRKWEYGYWTFMHQKGFLSDKEYANLTQVCSVKRTSNCEALQDAMWHQNLRGINPYDVYSDCIGQGAGGHLACLTQQLDVAIMDGKTDESITRNILQRLGNSQTFVPCMNLNNSVNWLNQEDVRTALHIPKEAFSWEPCSKHINYTQFSRNVPQLYQNMMGKIRIIVYSGDVDSCVPWLTTSHGVAQLNRKTLGPYKKWMYKEATANNTKQIGGYVQQYDGVDYATVRGAGHMVPTFKPQAGLGLLQKFLFNEPW